MTRHRLPKGLPPILAFPHKRIAGADTWTVEPNVWAESDDDPQHLATGWRSAGDGVSQQCDRFTLVSAETALSAAWNTDAHLALYRLRGQLRTPRLKKNGPDEHGTNGPTGALARLEAAVDEAGADVAAELVWVGVDIDNPDHDPWKSADDARARMESHVRAGALDGWGWYVTRGGARLIRPLVRPLVITSANARWVEALIRATLHQLADAGIGVVARKVSGDDPFRDVYPAGADPTTSSFVDANCTDWTRLFRLPFVTRDGEPQRWPADFSAMRPLDLEQLTPAWRPGESPEEISAKERAKAERARERAERQRRRDSQPDTGRPCRQSAGAATVDGEPLPSERERIEAARRYFDGYRVAVAGDGGHGRAYAAAVRATVGFDLSPAAAMEALADWNRRCDPPWSDAELARKIGDASRESVVRMGDEDLPRGGLCRLTPPNSTGVIPVGGTSLQTGQTSGFQPAPAPAPPPDPCQAFRATAGEGGVVDLFDQESQVAPHWAPLGKAVRRAVRWCDEGQKQLDETATAILTRRRSDRRWRDVAGEKRDNLPRDSHGSLVRNPKWEPVDAWFEGISLHDDLLATFGLMPGTPARVTDDGVPTPLGGHVVALRTIRVDADDFAEAYSTALTARSKVCNKRRLANPESGAVGIMGRGHSTYSPGRIEKWNTVIIAHAPDAEQLADVCERIDATRLPRGAAWIEAGFVQLPAEDAARIARRLVEAVPLWGVDPRAVAESHNGLRRARMVEKYGAIKERWHEAARPEPERDPRPQRDVLDVECVKRAAGTTDHACAEADVLSHARSTRHYLSACEHIVRAADAGSLDERDAAEALAFTASRLPVPTIVGGGGVLEYRVTPDMTPYDVGRLREEYEAVSEGLRRALGRADEDVASFDADANPGRW